MKKILCILLVIVMMPISVLAGTEVSITSPSNEQWFDAWNNDVVIKWTKPQSGQQCKISIVDSKGNYIEKNTVVSGTSYTLKKRTLDFWEEYKVWVGTFENGSAIGRGSEIYFNTNPTYDCAGLKKSEITVPSNNSTVECGKDVTIKWTSKPSGCKNVLKIKNETTGKTTVAEQTMSGTSYTVSGSLLDAENRYKVWLATFANETLVGEEIVYFNVGKKQEAEGATISSPENGEWLNPEKKITFSFSKPSSNTTLKIKIVNDVTGVIIANNETVSGTSYTLNKNVFIYGNRYKVTLTTYESGSSKVVNSHAICINTYGLEDATYKEAEFNKPSDEEVVSADENLKLSWDKHSDLSYRVSVRDMDTNETIYDEKPLLLGYAVISKDKLIPGHRYKAWIGTYISASIEEGYLGQGKEIYFEVEDDKNEDTDKEDDENEDVTSATLEAVFSSPDNNDIVNYKNDLIIEWKKSDIDTCFELTIKDTTDNSFIVKNEVVSGTSYKIKSSKLKAKHQYKAWIGTYNNSSDNKKLIGGGDEIYFSTDGTIPVLVKSLNADLEDKGLVFKYEFAGDNFGYATVIVTDSKGKTNYNEKVYDLNGEIIITTDKLEENCTYTCEIQTYTSSGEKAAYKAQEYTVTKSGFSVTGVVKPTGELIYKKGFTVKGMVGSAYPIAEAKIIIFTKGNESDVKDIVHLKNYNQTSNSSTQFNIKDYDSEVNFGILKPGEYTYKVTVSDTMGNSYTAVESSFSIVREKGTYDDVPSNHKNYKAIKQLSVDGILAGDGTGFFRPGDSITRAEFVKMLYYSFNLSPITYSGSGFSDVDTNHWAHTYIIAAFFKGIIDGKGNGKFAPEDNVTFEEAAKMLVCIKGWQDMAEWNGGWSGGGYIFVADKNGFFEATSVSDNYSLNASRADVAQMFYNAINKKTNDVVETDRAYTINGIKLYAIKFSDGYYYVDTSKAFPAFGGYDIKSKDSNLKGSLQIWDKNITDSGKSLKVDYDFTTKRNSYPPYEFYIKLTQNGVLLANSEYKNYFRKNKIQLAYREDTVFINVHDLEMITNHIIKNGEFVPDPDRNVTIIGGKLYSKDTVIKNAQDIYDRMEAMGGRSYLNDNISFYEECYNGTIEAYGKANNINKVYNTVGYLTTATLSVGSVCVGNITGFGAVAGTITADVTLDIAANTIAEICDTEDGFVAFMLASADVDAYRKFTQYHNSLNRDTMTKEQAIEYLTKYYEAKISIETILMAFQYFAYKCPENFGQALLESAKAAVAPIVTKITGKIFDGNEVAEIAYDTACFFAGVDLSLLDMLIQCNNEIVSEWAKEVKNLNNDLSKALYDGEHRGGSRKF